MGKIISIFLIIVLFLLTFGFDNSGGNTFLPYSIPMIAFSLNNIEAIILLILFTYFIKKRKKKIYYYLLSISTLFFLIVFPFFQKEDFQKLYGPYGKNDSHNIIKGYYEESDSFMKNIYFTYLPRPYFKDDINGYCKILNYFGKTDQLINNYYYIVDQSLNLGINNNILSCIDNKELYKLMIEFTKKEKFCLEKYGKIDRLKNECGFNYKVNVLLLLVDYDKSIIINNLTGGKFEMYQIPNGFWRQYEKERFLWKNF